MSAGTNNCKLNFGTNICKLNFGTNYCKLNFGTNNCKLNFMLFGIQATSVTQSKSYWQIAFDSDKSQQDTVEVISDGYVCWAEQQRTHLDHLQRLETRRRYRGL